LALNDAWLHVRLEKVLQMLLIDCQRGGVDRLADIYWGNRGNPRITGIRLDCSFFKVWVFCLHYLLLGWQVQLQLTRISVRTFAATFSARRATLECYQRRAMRVGAAKRLVLALPSICLARHSIEERIASSDNVGICN